VLACLLPLQAAALLALQLGGQVHTHRAITSITTALVGSWAPVNPIFQHRGAPAAHDESHASARHTHAVDDASVQVEADAVNGGSASTGTGTSNGNGGADGSGHSPGAAMAWAPPCAGFGCASVAGPAPGPDGSAHWRDAVLKPLERPPRQG
jgi:hypothetical protein